MIRVDDAFCVGDFKVYTRAKPEIGAIRWLVPLNDKMVREPSNGNRVSRENAGSVFVRCDERHVCLCYSVCH